MEYKLFEEYITLQALLKNLSIIQSGGAVKQFLADNTVYFNDEPESRRGKKIRIGDRITIPSQNISIIILEPSAEEIKLYHEEQEEKARVAALVKEMNKANKKSKQLEKKGNRKVSHKNRNPKSSPAVRFPGT